MWSVRGLHNGAAVTGSDILLLGDEKPFEVYDYTLWLAEAIFCVL